jgi:DUF4097 and DUF4098 domain-containing protein YvlB
VTLVVAGALACGASQAGAQTRIVRDRLVLRDRPVVVEYQGRDREQQTERFTRTLKIGANGEVAIGNISGDISVVRGSGNEATLEVVKTARSRSVEDAKELLGLVQVDISERGSRVEIKTRYPGDEYRRNNRRNINVSVSFMLTAPAGTRISAHSISGDIAAKDIKGDVALETVSGSVRISNAGRVAAAKSISGNVEITDTEIEGHLEASSVSGSVLLRNVKSRSLEAGAVSGNVVVQDVACDRVEAQTVSGDVQFAGTLLRSGRYELSSHSGGVQVAVAGDTGFEVEATSFSGSVRSEITLNQQGTGRYGRRQQTLRGIYGDGSAILDLTTFSGNIVITKR